MFAATATPTTPVQLTLLPPPQIDTRLLRLVRRLCYDDALVFGAYRLEYLYLGRGFIHYRLYWRGRVVYRQDVRSASVLDRVQQAVARELCAQGWQADVVRLVEFGALTALPPLVTVRSVGAPDMALVRGWRKFEGSVCNDL